MQRVGPSTGLPTRTAQGDLLSTAFLSHGDTKHILLIPSSVEECYELAMQAFDLSERFQTPIFVMMDLDLGMNNWMSNGFEYPTKPIDRGKLLTPEVLKKLGEWGRYKDVDGDGIPYRTIPGDGMPAFFTRGSGHNAKAQYSERPDDYVDNVDRLSAQVRDGAQARAGADRRDEQEREDRHHRLRHVALGDHREPRPASRGDQRRDARTSGCGRIPSPRISLSFIDAHERIYIVEQNRDAQLLMLMKLELSPERDREAAQRAALQRAADRRAQHQRRHPGAGRVRSGEAR